jgi:hypothetical protein
MVRRDEILCFDRESVPISNIREKIRCRIGKNHYLFYDESDAYAKLYREINDSLYVNEFSETELFEDFFKRCEQIFKIGEIDYGKAAKNLPDNYLKDIGLLYDSKIVEFGDMGCDGHFKKYDTGTQYLDYKDENCSLYDLEQMFLDEKNCYVSEARSDLARIKKDHLEDFFGIEYKNKNPVEQKYESIKLIKILCCCKCEIKVDLAYLKRMSFFRFKNQLPSEYEQAIKFIKKKLSNGLSFTEIIWVEYFNSLLRNCIKALGEGVAEYVIGNFPFAGCTLQRKIRKDVYSVINAKLKQLNENQINRLIKTEIPMQLEAYLHFIEWGIKDTIESLKIESEDMLMNIDEKVYMEADQFIKKK